MDYEAGFKSVLPILPNERYQVQIRCTQGNVTLMHIVASGLFTVNGILEV